MTAENPSDIPRMRISDADRDRVAAVLSNALAEGRLTAEEHSERLDAIYAARTQAEIAPIVSDLPGGSTALVASGGQLLPAGSAGAITTRGKRARMLALVSGVRRRGAWQVPERMQATTVLGGVDLDLRQAILPPGEISLRAVCVLGGVDIVVPPEMRVIDDGWAIVGGIEVPPETPESSAQDAPVLRITGLAILGGISIKRKPR